MSCVAEDAACLAAASRRLTSLRFMALVAAVLVAERSSSAADLKASWCRASCGLLAQPCNNHRTTREQLIAVHNNRERNESRLV